MSGRSPSDRSPPNGGLDAERWDELRAQSHRMLDDMLDYLQGIRDRPAWQPMDSTVRAAFRAGLPRRPTELAAVHADFLRYVLPHAAGNVHPGFMGWVQGGGTAVGMLAEMLAGGLNANCGGRDHSPIEVERQVVDWVRQWFAFPRDASGLFVTGTSMANLIALLVARRAALGPEVRRAGVAAASASTSAGAGAGMGAGTGTGASASAGATLVAYASVAAHTCIARAMDYAGLGSGQLRLIPVDGDQRIDLDALRRAIAADRASGSKPFLIVGNAGTVDIGAIDDLSALAELAAAQGLWFHIDGAFGALAILSPEIAPRLAGIERADSLAFDFHKWGQVPYDAGFVLVRDGALHRDTFATSVDYLQRQARGLAAGEFWPTDFGPDLSRGFRALKTWITLRVHGTDALGAAIAETCRIARHLQARVDSEPRLERLAPVPLNIVCFRYRGAHASAEAGADAEADALNAAIVADVQESGVAVPSATRVRGRLAIRAAIFNHRTRERDVDAMLDAVLSHGDRRTRGRPGP